MNTDQYAYFVPSIILAILLLGGTILGFAQYLLLQTHLARAGWWAVANTIAWPISLIALPYLLHQLVERTLLPSTPEWPWIFSLGYVTVSAMTGVVLVRLPLHERKNNKQPEPKEIISLARSH